MKLLRAIREGLASMFDFCPHVSTRKFKRRDPEDDAKKLAADWAKVQGDLVKAFQKYKDEQEK
jgi:hypothetical protein